MRITEVISELELIHKKVGDVEVKYDPIEGVRIALDVEGVEVAQTGDRTGYLAVLRRTNPVVQ